MPEKHLPFYRLPLLGKEKQPKKQSPNSPSSNFVLHEEFIPASNYQLVVITGLIRKSTTAILVVFGLMLAMNIFLNLKLESQKIVNNTVADHLQRFKPIEQDAILLDKKTKFYEKTIAERSVLGDKSRVVFSNLDSSIVLNTASILVAKFTLDITVKSPLDFALLATRYLKESNIDSITLVSANYKPDSQQYHVVLEGNFK
jgi:hypothetical protein